MPLIVEDGTGIEDANSFVGLDEARSLATIRGIDLSSDDEELSKQLVQSADRINSYETQFSGHRTFAVQALAFPRSNAFRFGAVMPRDSIPREVKLAQVTVCDLISRDVEVWTTDISGIKEEVVGPLKTVYSDNQADSVGNPSLPQVESILNPLFANVGGFFRVGR